MLSSRGRNVVRASSQPAHARRLLESGNRSSFVDVSRDAQGRVHSCASSRVRASSPNSSLAHADNADASLQKRLPPKRICRAGSESPGSGSQSRQTRTLQQFSRQSSSEEKNAASEVVSASAKRPPLLRRMGGGAMPRPRRLDAISGASRPSEMVFGKCGIMTRIVQHLTLQGLCACQSVSMSALKACTSNQLWEQLCKTRWPKASAALEHTSNWKAEFLSLLRKCQQTFASKHLPAVFKKAKRRDGLPDLQKMHEALRVRYALRLCFSGSRASASGERDLPLSGDSITTFQSSTCLRCSFSSLKVRAPVRMMILGHSATLGKDVPLLSVDLPDLSAWKEDPSRDDNFRFVHSSCGQVLASIWRTDNTIAGLFFSIHHAHSLQLFCHGSACEYSLVQRPEYDDVDSRLGLHDYTLMVTLRSAKLETFSYCFYKIAARKIDAVVPAQVDNKHLITQSERAHKSRIDLAEEDASVSARRVVAKASMSKSRPRLSSNALPWMQPERRLGTGHYQTDMAYFEVLSPHASGEMPAFSCGQLRILFQTSAFRCVLPDTTFLDATALDEHGHVFWAASSVTRVTSEVPHSALKSEADAIDFDRDDSSESTNVRWICLGDVGVASLVLQLSMSYDAGGAFAGYTPLDDDAHLSKLRLNVVSWHPEVTYLNWWFGSKYLTSGHP